MTDSELEKVFLEYKKTGGRLREETFLRYVPLARQKLVKVAKKKSTIAYGDLIDDLGTNRAYIGGMMFGVSLIEYWAKRPLLSAVVVGNASCNPGGGFLGLPGIPKEVRRAEGHQNADYALAEREFWESELARVYDYWTTHRI